MRAIQRAFREALLALPPEEYDWFDIQARARTTPGARETQGNGGGTEGELDSQVPGVIEPEPAQESQRHFFEHPGPLFSVLVSPMTSTVAVNESRRFKALARDRSRRRVEEDLQFFWEGVEGGGTLSADRNQEIIFTAPAAPELIRLRVTVTQGEITCTADALVTVTDTLASQGSTGMTNARGLPGYTFERAAGELWRSRFDADRNVIVVNNGHRDFVFASRSQSLKLRYLIRLYIKELVLRNFAGLPVDKSLERMVELSLYTEEKL
jgi:hypothetical protein